MRGEKDVDEVFSRVYFWKIRQSGMTINDIKIE